MEFKQYQHIERLGTTEVNGILDGMCYVFPKIDGTNSQLWLDSNFGIHAGSRKRELSLDSDNAGFMNWAVCQQNLFDLLRKYPNIRLYGEWLVPYIFKTYRQDCWRKFYVFDVMVREKYIPYENYASILDDFGVDYIPPICKINNPTQERIYEQLEKNGYLIEDGNGTGEGVVVKNYSFINKYGRTTWAKVVKNEFKAMHAKKEVAEIKERIQVENAIVDKYVTTSLIEKEKAKILLDVDWSSKLIPRLLNTVYFCLVSEECWNFVKEFKNPIIDFKRLQFLTTAKIKELCPEIFN